MSKNKNAAVLDKAVEPGEIYEWKIDIKTPKDPKTYFGEFGLFTQQGKTCKHNGSVKMLEIRFDVVVPT